MKHISISVDGASYPVPFGTDLGVLTSQLKEAVDLGRTVVIDDDDSGSVLLINGRCASVIFIEVTNQPGGGPPSM